jgi:hypothetical protein
VAPDLFQDPDESFLRHDEGVAVQEESTERNPRTVVSMISRKLIPSIPR